MSTDDAINRLAKLDTCAVSDALAYSDLTTGPAGQPCRMRSIALG